ncbi:MAG: hypothetical protein E2O87_04600 [Bacteroidetes bacterium]|nr:MAG: hypothetical protein E2O87_04600 [Bacteroidota bacterium]
MCRKLAFLGEKDEKLAYTLNIMDLIEIISRIDNTHRKITGGKMSKLDLKIRYTAVHDRTS